MKTKLRIKNFRVFDENGAIFDLNPITILTGSNSSGKSSAVKAIILLNGFLSQVKKAIDNDEPVELQNYKLDFTKYPINLLGRFDKVIHNGALSKSITIEYTVYSLMLSKEVNVQMTFAADANDKLNNAFIESISMSTEEGVFFSSDKSAGTYCNLNIIKEDYATFLLAEYMVYSYSQCATNYEFGGIEKEIYDKNVKEIINFLRKTDRSRRRDAMCYVRTKEHNHAIISNKKEFDAIEQTISKDTLFDIPILNELKKIGKEKIEEFIFSLFPDNKEEAFVFVTKKVINTFDKSEFDNFYDFFLNAERKHLEQIHCTGDVFDLDTKGVHMLHASELKIHQNLLLCNPYNFTTVLTFDEDYNQVQLNKKDEEAEKEKEIEQWKNQPLTFDNIYEIVMEWDRYFSKERNENCIYRDSSTFDPFDRVDHISYILLTKFSEALVREAVTPDWCGNMSYISSSRASVSRLYTLDNKDDFSQLLQDYFEKKRLYLDYQKNYHYIGKRNYEADSFMNKWIQKFDIGNKISITTDHEGLGIQIWLQKNTEGSDILLADEGYGITQLVSILLQIETAILSAQGEKVNKHFRLENLDRYDTEVFHYEINTISIEEPEIHLHPKYQSLLADMFVEAYEKYNIHFVIETHSEYLIRKLQLLATGHIDDVKLERSDVSIYYVYSKGDKSSQKVKRIGICSDGYLDDTFGEGFYDEATRLSRQLM